MNIPIGDIQRFISIETKMAKNKEVVEVLLRLNHLVEEEIKDYDHLQVLNFGAK